MTRRDLVLVQHPREEPPREPRTDYPSAARDALLWFAILGGPVAWTIDSLAAVFLEESWCAGATTHREAAFGGIFPLLIVIGILMAAGAVTAGLVGWRAMDAVGMDTGRDGTAHDRRRFMAHAGTLISMLFLFGIVLRWIAVFFVDPRICTLGS